MMETNDISSDDKAVVKVDKNNIPDEIPILPLDEQVAFPTLFNLKSNLRPLRPRQNQTECSNEGGAEVAAVLIDNITIKF